MVTLPNGVQVHNPLTACISQTIDVQFSGPLVNGTNWTFVNNSHPKSKCVDVDNPLWDSYCELYEGESIENHTFIEFISSDLVKLNRDGEVTNSLGEGQTYLFSSGEKLMVKDIYHSSYQGYDSKVAFYLKEPVIRSKCVDVDNPLWDSYCELYEDESIENHTFMIFISYDFVRLSRYGEITNSLSVGETYLFGSGEKLMVQDIHYAPTVLSDSSVDFYIDKPNIAVRVINWFKNLFS